jgi:hypothetical protein
MDAWESERELPLLGGIATCLRWLEELVVLLSGPMLTLGLGIGLVALLSDGALLVSSPGLLYVWAVAQTVGVDGQLVGMWYRVSVALSRKRYGVAAAFGLLGLLLAYVGYVAALVFAYQQAYGLSTTQALAKLGMDSTSWLWQRAAVSVFLVCLSGYLRYRAPRKETATLDEKKRAIQEQMELAALKQQQRAQQAQGAISLLRGAVEAARGAGVGADAAASPTEVTSPTAPGEEWDEERDDGDQEPTGEVAVGADPFAPLPMAWHHGASRSTNRRRRTDPR